ncbi:MAG: MarC family protein [Treponema sp.]
MNMDIFSQFLKIFFTFIILLDPLGNTPPFLAVASAYDRKTQLHILKEAVIIAGAVLFIFAVFGHFILTFFGITAGAFYISGGIILFTIALDMIQSKPRARHTPRSTLDSEQTTMIAVFPLAIPLIAGPGMITTIMLYTASSPFSFITFMMAVTALVLGLFIEYFVLRSASLLVKVIGTTGLFVLEKIVGLILAGLSVQLVYDGLQKLGLFI